jgi:ABC-type phosphate transport system permease subunit
LIHGFFRLPVYIDAAREALAEAANAVREAAIGARAA